MPFKMKRMVYVRDIPVPIRQDICGFLDDVYGLKNWRHLAGLLGYSNDDISLFQRSMNRPGGSPTDDMLTTWDYENHTIEELFLKLYELRHARCMMLLKDLVDPSLHQLIDRIRNTPPLSPEQLAYDHPGRAVSPVGQPSGRMVVPLQPENSGNKFASSFLPQHPQFATPSMAQMPHNQSQQQHPPQCQPHYPQHGKYPAAPTPPPVDRRLHLPFQPVDTSKMMAAAPQAGSTTSNNESPQSTFNQQYPVPQQQQGRVLLRFPSEHPIGPPRRFQSHHSNQDNFAPPPGLSPEALNSCRPPEFQASPSGTPTKETAIEHCLLTTIEKSYSELCQATENFSDSYKLGEGSFGTVYYGQLNMTDVAIKKIKKIDHVMFDQSKIRGDQMKEILALTKYRHPNIVSLTSYAINDGCLYLIFAFMKNGSLDSHLEGRSHCEPLEWKTRHKIAEGAARGIHYLHTAQEIPLIHQDIKSANILLDDNLVAKIADFGLARPGPSNGKEYTAIKTSVVFGTKAYLAPEFLRDSRRKLSTRLDVYSFGVVLMELVTGAKAGEAKGRFKYQLLSKCVDEVIAAHEGNPQKAVDLLLDPRCENWPSLYVWQLLSLASKCTEEFKRRPEMREVVETLSEIRGRIEEEERNKYQPSRRQAVLPSENTEPIQFRQGMESSGSSISSHGQELPNATSAPDACIENNLNEVSKEKAKFKDTSYSELAALEGGHRILNLENGGHSAAASHCKTAGSVRNQQNFVYGVNAHPAPAQSQARELPGCSQASDPQMRAGVGVHMGNLIPSHHPSHVHMYAPTAPSESTMSPSPASSYSSHLQCNDVTSSSQSSKDMQDQGYSNGSFPVQDCQHPHRFQEGNYGRQGPMYHNHMTGYPLYHAPQDPEYRAEMYYRNPRCEHQEEPGLLHRGPAEEMQSTATSTTTSSDQSGMSLPPPRYPMMPTLKLHNLSIESSDQSNSTIETSLQTLSDEGSTTGERPGASPGGGEVPPVRDGDCAAGRIPPFLPSDKDTAPVPAEDGSNGETKLHRHPAEEGEP